MIKSFSEFISESAAVAPSPVKDILSKLVSSDSKRGGSEDAIDTMYMWFNGGIMGPKAFPKNVEMVEKNFATIGEKYHKPITGYIYRFVHIPTKLKTEAEIKKITKAPTGIKRIQSWAMTKAGAEFFFNHFIHGQNHDDVPHHDVALVLIKAKASDVQQLLTYDECLDFIDDLIAYEGDKNHTPEFKAWLTRGSLHKLHEVMCIAKEETDIQVLEVKTLPKS